MNQLFKNNQLAEDVFTEKYALPGETPDQLFTRVADEFIIQEKYRYQTLTKEHRNEIKDKLSTLGKIYLETLEKEDETLPDIFAAYLSNFTNIIPGGSVLSTLGTDKLSSLSNCFVIASPEDSITGIFNTCNEQSQLMKYRGGVGIDISSLRPSNATVQNSAKTSSGSVSFTHLFSQVTNIIGQNNRRGALMLSISINHPDIEEFILVKQDLTKVTGANMSVKVTNEFMEAVERNEDYILTYPIDQRLKPSDVEGYKEYNKLYLNPYGPGFFKRIKALELWNKLIHCAWNTAEPGIIFEDHHNNYSPDSVYEDYKFISTNPCQPKWATILTPNGIKTFDEINVGDTIWSSEGWTTILRKEYAGIKEVNEYRTTAGSFIGTDTHKIISNNEKVEVKDADFIDALAGNEPESLSLFNQDVMDGLVIGDGSVHIASNNLVYLCIGDNDGDYLLSEIQPLIKECRPGIKSYAFEVDTTITYKELSQTFLREIPERFIKGTPSTVCGFLRGLYSANGSVVNNRVTLKTTSPILRDTVQLMLSSVGIRSYYTTNKETETTFNNGTYTCKESYDINISTDRGIFYRNIGFIQRYKMKKLNDSLKSIRDGIKSHNIISTIPISTEEVFNITVDNSSHTYWTGGLNVSNCGEIAMQPYDSCRLIHHNFTSFIIGEPYTDSAEINWEFAYDQFYIGMILGDILIDLEVQAIQKIIAKINLDNNILPENKKVELELWNKIIASAQSTRRTGIGFTALADMLAMLNLSYGSKESLEIVDKLMYQKQKAELNATIDLALMYGPFKGYDEYKERNLFFDHIKSTFPEEYIRMLKYGRRNLSFSTVAPTGSISILTQTSSGIEPVFLPFYQRKRKVTNENDKVDFIDKVGVKYTTYNVIHKPLMDWIMITKQIPMEDLLQMPIEKLQELFEGSPWYKNCASDINYINRLKMQSVIQKYTTHSISSTLNLPKETKDSVIDNIYREAYKLNLKGVTVYRDGSRDGILTSINTKPTSTAFLETKAPKRPTSLPAKLDIVTIKGQPFAIIVGLYENKPYEVFAFKLTDPSIRECTGIIKKKAKKVYDFSSEGVYIPNLELSYESIEEKAFTLYTSMSLRHGVNIKYIIKTLNKVDENITSFAKALNRVLSKYIPKETTDELCPECGNPLVREAGCIKCLHCSYSRC